MVTYQELDERKARVAVVGLGYVGLPLAALLGRRFEVVGYDRDAARIAELRQAFDRTGEVSESALAASDVDFTDDPASLRQAGVIILAIPTPVDEHKSPDLEPLRSATATVGRHMQPGCVVVYESTVYPGATEEVCVPILEAESGLKWGKDFALGYSPERINPGDRTHTIERVIKIVSGDTTATADLLARMYGAVIPAGIHVAPSIKTAEAAKIIENVQRDLNIALMNELAIIFGRLGLDTRAVLEAAGTKWNFLKFEPGMVGGHCIPVDPYYLTHKAQEIGYRPEVILAGRRLNDSMGKYVAEQTVKQLIRAHARVAGAKVLVMGLTFKEDVSDLRNTQVLQMCRELREYGVVVYAYEPHADLDGHLRTEAIQILDAPEAAAPFDAVVVAVRHSAFRDLGMGYFQGLSTQSPVLIDVRGAYSPEEARERGMGYWRL